MTEDNDNSMSSIASPISLEEHVVEQDRNEVDNSMTGETTTVSQGDSSGEMNEVLPEKVGELPPELECLPQLELEIFPQPEIPAAAEAQVDALIPAQPVNWEERCAQLERQLAKAAEATTLRKRLIEIRETESKSLTSKLKILSESIGEEKRLRTDLLTRVEAAELECMTVKDKLRRNLESLERMKGHHERRVTMLSANLEIADIKAQGNARKLEESHRINAEQKGLLEELTMKLNENKKVTKGLEKQLKKSTEKNAFLTSQVALIGQLLGSGGDESDPALGTASSSSSSSSPIDEESSLWKIKNIIRQSENASAPEVEKAPGSKEDDEDEGVEISSLLELENDDDSEAEPVKDIPGEESCYKRVDTSTGPKFILSVSQTFIKLKDLILEKRSLQQHIDGLKNLNTKLESKTDKQERRLYCVTRELNKTWHLVSKLKVQQDRLHSNEAFLRYELKENRVIVEKLKKEMQSYKEKWRKVREKNDESQCVWQQLKDEFAQRRQESLAQGQSASPLSMSNSPSPPREDSELFSVEDLEEVPAEETNPINVPVTETPSAIITITTQPLDPEAELELDTQV